MKLLFVCRGNVARSQMARAFYEKYSGLKAEAAGTGKRTHEKQGEKIKDIPEAEFVIRCMKEEGLDLSERFRSPLTPEKVNGADKIIIMAEKETIPDYLTNSSKTIYWEFDDPLGATYENTRRVRDEIKSKVLELIKTENRE